MNSFCKSVLLLTLVSLIVFGDQAMAQRRGVSRSNVAVPQRTNEVEYKSEKLNIDTPLDILKEAANAGKSNYKVWNAATLYLGQCYLLGHNGCPKDEKRAAELFAELFNRLDIGTANIARWTPDIEMSDSVGPGRDQRVVINQQSIPALEPDQRTLPGRSPQGADLLSTYIEGIRKDAEQGSVDAQEKLGIYYAIGMGVPKDARESAKWVRKAADQGSAGAQYVLATYYAEGYGGLPVSQTEFIKWLSKVAGQGDQNAKDILDLFGN